jgi:hypothetical protein
MSLNFEELAAEQSRLNNKGNSDWKKKYVQMPPGEGSVFIRLLPPAPGAPWYYATRWHKIGTKGYYSHLEYVKGKWEGKCPINDEYRRLWDEINRLEKMKRMDAAQELKELSRKIGPIKKYHYACIVRSEFENGKEIINSGPKIYSAGEDVHKKIINKVMGQQTLKIKGIGEVCAFEFDKNGKPTGRDFQIIKSIRKGDDGYPEYNQSDFVEPSVAGTKEEWERWMANLPDLRAERRLKPISEIQEALDVFFGRKPDTSTQVAGSSAFVERRNAAPVAPPKPVEVQRPVIQDVITTDDDLPPDDDFIEQLRRV